MKSSISFLTLLVRFGGTVVVQPPGDVNGLASIWCYTYLSTYLEPITTGSTSPSPTSLSVSPNPSAIGSTSTLSVLRTPPTSLPGSTTASDTTTILGFTSSSGYVTPSGLSPFSSSALPLIPSSSLTTELVSTPTPSALVDRQIILFILPGGVTKRDLRKRNLGGFFKNDIAADRLSCDAATIFNLSLSRLLYAGNPIHYTPGDNNKALRTTTVPSVNAITTTFGIVGGTLQFLNSSLPGGRANFCQDPLGQVYITFASTPVDCAPVQILAYGGKMDLSL
ncbi:uncharacterized protein CTRU02_206973 [Colletotrichum truncatum]|uniref:Uncharacterized protein n=1 Tax=Colletotrichum truncatum TaxID=5467 RepID=A0ACC3YZB2_COLTU|nr:uncharacterized protein CTRU02_11174 [Colletotrichum truncatum]KAF6786303.1 hypothetical protein CTRU02_11174 [Colletotrichum truncatum]